MLDVGLDVHSRQSSLRILNSSGGLVNRCEVSETNPRWLRSSSSGSQPAKLSSMRAAGSNAGAPAETGSKMSIQMRPREEMPA